MKETVLVVIPAKYRKYVDEEISLVKTVYSNYSIEKIIVNKINKKQYISKRIIDLIKSNGFSKVVIMDILKPRHFIQLYRELGIEVKDRMQLILEIFALHAGSKEALLQIELAELRHRLPLIKEAIRYAKLGELHGFLGGGRYGYEKYYTMAKKRMARIRRELEELRRVRETRRRARSRLGLPHIALVGYTCAGKTTLFNYLTRQYKPVGPEPFTTLSPKASSVVYKGKKFIFVDTVGFVRDIPHEIIEAFYATLDEIVYSDVIVDIIDSSKSPDEVIVEIRETHKILKNIGVHGKPIVYALNKIDLVDKEHIETIVDRLRSYDEEIGNNVITISAVKGTNVDKLLGIIYKLLYECKNIT